ncbi:ergothioneine biosynthesis protein EgtB [Sinimarinibacterium sp. CAU 1509]|uniref:ergothioneine biosynthesis protein EgtB n=1 Tax=Sinimarinibacterium sp. CAU 1509 TaxID=2562283 RepID=UPI0010ABADB3|nr:ergothioneine biosynthesis protein EgtB [Sinimarinibacterium sp. CAU 1509]TJY63222.1 ergothioneine biosynthesis protein EgtB [Sinimarinibacterium sp. CAU 1509]
MQHVRLRTGVDGLDALLARYGEVRQRSVALIDGLSAEDCQVQSMPDVSPAKWHLAHTSWFFETFVLSVCDSAYPAFDPHFAELFNSYYNSVGRMHPRPQRGLLTRPSLQTVLAYRAHVDAWMQRLAGTVLATGLAERIELGLQHEQQHQELMLTDIKHVLGCNPMRPAYADRPPPQSARQAQAWMNLEPGLRLMGHHGDGFSFDNEGPQHRVWLNAAQLALRPVTNGEYLEFIRDGGYRQALLWLSEGWSAIQAQQWTRPLYWQASLESEFGLYGEQSLDLHAPVNHLSYFEADAFARWAGARLPTEFEWEAAFAPAWTEAYVRGDALTPTMSGASGLSCGAVWEWTSSAYAAYPGFRTAEGAIGEYNGKFMCNQFVLRGGSCATPEGHVRATYRNFFPASAQWQFTGLRLARDGDA